MLPHDELGGDSLRMRVILIYECTARTFMLPPFSISTRSLVSKGVKGHLVPLDEVPTEAWLHGDYLLDGASQDTRPATVAKLGWGGPDSELERGSLVKLYNSHARWRVMEVDDDVIKVMRSSRTNPTRFSVASDDIEKVMWQRLAVHSIDDPSRSVRSFGEWPARNVELIHDRRKCGLSDDDPHWYGCSCVRAILAREAWSLQELPDELYDQAVEYGATQDMLCRYAGNSIPYRTMLIPVAQAVKDRLQQIDDYMEAARRHSEARRLRHRVRRCNWASAAQW